MISENPFAKFREECKTALTKAMKETLPQIELNNLQLKKPPNIDFGQLASSICFALGKKLNKNPWDVADSLVTLIDSSDFDFIEKVITTRGYINFHLNFSKFANLTLSSIKKLNKQYGFPKTKIAKKIIIEHTSVNPLHPIHIGQARNPIIGDALARILDQRGHYVSRHYYIDDVGRQSSVVAYGYDKLGRPEPNEKSDHFVGKIYTITCCLVEIKRLKGIIAETELSSSEEISKLKLALHEWLSISEELKQKYPILFADLYKKIDSEKNPEEDINKLNRGYEEGSFEAKKLVRTVSKLCLKGFRETQKRIKIFYDSWDWESDLVWSNKVNDVLQNLRDSPFVYSDGEVLEFNAENVALSLALKPKLGLRADYEIPPLTLVRSDGTTLYTTRDIAYTLWKFTRAEKVINVIGMEQSLAQLQLKLALYALDQNEYADNFVHFAYNLVSLPGYKMSSRRGRYITFDEVLDEAIERAYKEVSKRSPNLSDNEKQKISKFVGIGAVRYALIDVDPSKPVVFTWDRVLNFETNSAPYAQYTHARACSILRKSKNQPKIQNLDVLKKKLERELILSLASFPDVFLEANEYLKPNMIADYVNTLADKFNSFYNAFPVIKAETPTLRDARLNLTEAITIVLSNALNLIGIFAPERM
ncbi:MAG: arginine--tRNA ligase [Candidatus Bathyarchaeota archaeon]|nr:arginine--tRNA ligase [Candidatus Bathyarchaeota archaeon]